MFSCWEKGDPAPLLLPQHLSNTFLPHATFLKSALLMSPSAIISFLLFSLFFLFLQQILPGHHYVPGLVLGSGEMYIREQDRRVHFLYVHSLVKFKLPLKSLLIIRF